MLDNDTVWYGYDMIFFFGSDGVFFSFSWE